MCTLIINCLSGIKQVSDGSKRFPYYDGNGLFLTLFDPVFVDFCGLSQGQIEFYRNSRLPCRLNFERAP